MTNSTTNIPILDDDAVAQLQARGITSLRGSTTRLDRILLTPTERDALCATVRALRAEKAEQRGLTLISALVNFTDWLHAEGLLNVDDERERAQLVLKFFDAHSKGENYFMQAEQIMEILGRPFQETQ